MSKCYDFNERLRLSQGFSNNKKVEEIILQNVPGALKVISAHACNDRHGTDFWVEHQNGNFLKVDCKIREEDWSVKEKNPSDDLALETWSVVEKKVIGWTRDQTKRTDYIVWLWMDTGRWCMVPFVMLCKVFQVKWQAWSNKFQTSQQVTTGYNRKQYHSECIFVPRRELWGEIFKLFGNGSNPSREEYILTPNSTKLTGNQKSIFEGN